MRKMKFGVLCFLLPVLLFSACGQGNTNGTPTTAAQGSASPGTGGAAASPSAPDFTYQTDGMLNVYLPSADAGEGVGYASYLAQSKGFNIVFKSGPAMVSKAGDYTNFMAQNPGGVYLMMMYYAGQLYESGAIGDFTTQANTYAPTYFSDWASENPSGKLYFMPTDEQSFPLRICAFVKTDLYNSYGKTVKTGSDYEAMLKWLKSRNPDAVPCLARIDSLMNLSQIGLFPVSLFLPDAGYTSLATMFADTNGIYNSLWMKDSDGSVLPFYDIPEAADALTRFIGWKSEGLADFDMGVVEFKGASYDTVLTSSIYITNMLADMDGYTFLVFDQPALSTPEVDTVAVAAPGTDISEFLKFMEWMDSNIENYIYFMYGIEGVDYKNDSNGNIESRGLIPGHFDWSGSTYFFQRRNNIALSTKDFGAYGIDGYTKDFYSLPAADFPLDWQTRFEIGNQLNPDTGSFITGYGLAFTSFYQNIARQFPSWTSGSMPANVLDALKNLDNSNSQETAAQLVNQALGKQGP